MLGCVFGGVGLLMIISGSIGLLDRSVGTFGGAAAALAIGFAAFCISVIVLAAGRMTYRAYRKRGLL